MNKNFKPPTFSVLRQKVADAMKESNAPISWVETMGDVGYEGGSWISSFVNSIDDSPTDADEFVESLHDPIIFFVDDVTSEGFTKKDLSMLRLILDNLKGKIS